MSQEQSNYFGNRLKLARKMAGLSLQEVADKLENLITKQSLSKYELGQMKPTTDVLLELSKSLNIKPDYFLKQNQTELGQISFRKGSGLSKKDEEAIVEKARDYVERVLELENLLGIDNSFINPLQNIPVSTYLDVEKAAYELRKIWELGAGPISNIVEILELRGIKIFLIEDTDDFDGFAVFTTDGVPIVVINTKNKSLERIRFTIIHELAHILLKFSVEAQFNEKVIEVLCHHFSSCFLIPSRYLVKMIGGARRSYFTLNELITIKESSGMSIAAILHRLKHLEVITPLYYKKWNVYMNKNYGKLREPGHYQGEETSKYFEQLINRALSEEIISISKAAALSNCTINDLRKKIISVN